MPSGFATGDLVRLKRDKNFYADVIPAGSTGIVMDANTFPHATANGGGFDVRVWWDDFVGYHTWPVNGYTDKITVNSKDLEKI